MNIQDIKLNDTNPRKISEEAFTKLKNSIKEDPQMLEARPIIIDENNMVLGGNMRLRALKELGYEEVPTTQVKGWTEEQKRRFIVKDNLSGGEWDYDLLTAQYDAEELSAWGMEGLDKYFIDEPSEKDDEVPETPVEPKSKLGDLYEIGNHRIICWDSTDESGINRLTGGKQMDISFTSPPYNVGHNLGYDDKDSKYIHEDNKIDYQDLIVKTTQISLDYAKDVFVNLQFLAGNKRQLLLWLAELADNFKDIFFWKKSQVQPAMAENVANSQVEVIVLFGKNNNSRSWGNKKFRGNFSNHIETNSASGENKNSKVHNATFPVELPYRFLLQGYEKGSSVLDLFGGTGTTAIACEKLEMKAHCVDIEPLYVDIMVQRIVDFTGNENIKLNGEPIIWKQTQK